MIVQMSQINFFFFFYDQILFIVINTIVGKLKKWDFKYSVKNYIYFKNDIIFRLIAVLM